MVITTIDWCLLSSITMLHHQLHLDPHAAGPIVFRFGFSVPFIFFFVNSQITIIIIIFLSLLAGIYLPIFIFTGWRRYSPNSCRNYPFSFGSNSWFVDVFIYITIATTLGFIVVFYSNDLFLSRSLPRVTFFFRGHFVYQRLLHSQRVWARRRWSRSVTT